MSYVGPLQGIKVARLNGTGRAMGKEERRQKPRGKADDAEKAMGNGATAPRRLWARREAVGGLIDKMTPLDAGVVLAVRITCGVTDGRKASGLVGVVPAADKGRL